jgi:hypothetical protein
MSVTPVLGLGTRLAVLAAAAVNAGASQPKADAGVESPEPSSS